MTKNRVHMQINQVSNQLKALISEKHLIELAKTSGFQVRHRCLLIVSLLKAVFKSLSCLQDGASFSQLAQAFVGRFTAISPAVIELHVTYELFNEQPCEIDVCSDVETERAFLLGSHTTAAP